MQNYNEPASRMLRLPTWTAGNGSVEGGSVYSNRQSYFGGNCNLNGFPVPPQNPPPTPMQVFYPPPPLNSRLPVFHLRSCAPGMGTVLQQGHRELGLATGIGASSSSCHKDPVSIPIQPTLAIPSARRQRKSVFVARPCNNETETCPVDSCGAMASTGTGKSATISKRPRGRPPGKKNRLPVAQVSPLIQNLGSDTLSRMNFEPRTFDTSNYFGRNPYGPHPALFSLRHQDVAKDYEFADDQRRCKLLLEYIREKTCDYPERFNTFLNLMKLYQENGDWRTLYEDTDRLFHDYPEILTEVKNLISPSNGGRLLDDSCANNFFPGDNVFTSCVRGNARLETSSCSQRYSQNTYGHRSIPTGSEFPEGTVAAQNTDECKFVQGHRYAPNWLTNVPEPPVMPYETRPQQQHYVNPEDASTYSLEPIVLAETTVKPNISEDKNTREDIHEVCSDFDDEFHRPSTSFACSVDEGKTHVMGMQKTKKQKKVMDFRDDEETITHERVQTVRKQKKSGKLVSDPKLYGLLSAIHLFGTTANDILFQNNVGNITNDKLEEKLSRLIFNEADDTKWKTRLLRLAYPASRLTLPHVFQCLQLLLRIDTPLHFLDEEEPSSKSSSNSEDTVIDGTGEFKFVDYENFERLGKSYYQYPDSFVHPNYTGRDEHGIEVLNNKYFLVASTENKIRDKSDYETAMENLEDVRYEVSACECYYHNSMSL
ncbi:unnamed protein product [Orchesella dallaii]|uniref:Histone deacetylase interacting domain-containing protein n=1 Tax=Orchesella dallaii TaxID=48710 RepID=A0ABP1QKJ7_9HEXA